MSALSAVASTIDFTRLRAARRERLFDAMDRAGLDALILGRPANVLYASGARQLWTAGARPFGPACVVVGATARVHLLSVWDEGVPPEITHDDLYGLSWNPAIITANLQAIDGLAAARRIGTDSFSPGFGHLIEVLAPGATVIDGRHALFGARAGKTVDEIAAITIAVTIAEAALAAMAAALRPGITERSLRGIYLERIASLGAPTPPSEAVASITDDLVALNPGAMYAGYEGGVGRTFAIGAPSSALADASAALADASAAELDRLIDQCRPGPWAGGHLYGLGLGMEPPVVPPMAGAVLQAGMVVAVQTSASGFLERETVLITDGDPVVLTQARRGLRTVS